MATETVADLYREAEDPDHIIKQRRRAPLRLLSNAAHLYRLRLREQPLQEALALIGIAAGVALLFAVQVATSSVTGSLEQLAHAVTGKASLEIAARGPAGIDQSVVTKAQALPGVSGAAPIVERRIMVVGPGGGEPLTLVGVDQRLREIGGPLIKSFATKRGDLESLGLYLTSDTAKRIGATVGQELTIRSGAKRQTQILAGVLGPNDIGDLTKSPVALAPLGTAQRIADMPGRISRVLVRPEPGESARATAGLRTLAADRADVRPSDSEVKLLATAMKPDQQSSSLFGAIAVAIGLLFAYNAILLAMAWRRRFIAYLRLIGADRASVAATLGFEALVLGLFASAVGIAVGYVLAQVTFNSVPSYLASSFAIGAQHTVDAKTIALSLAGGLAATTCAMAMPALELFRVRPGEREGERVAGKVRIESIFGSKSLWLGLFVIAATSAMLLLAPKLTPVGTPALIAGLVLITGPILAWALTTIWRVTRVRGDVALAVAVEQLKSDPVRSAALAMIAAGAIAAVVSISGSRLDLERGVENLNRNAFPAGSVWIAIDSPANAFLSLPFDPHETLERIGKSDQFKDAVVYRGSFLDLGGRRLWITAIPPREGIGLVTDQVWTGNARSASARIRSGGWVAVSTSIAKRLGDRKPGDRIAIPTPSGNRYFRIAALTANYGWPSGSIVMNADDYGNAWRDGYASAVSVLLPPDVSPAAAKRSVSQSLGQSGSALHAQTGSEMVAERLRTLSQGLARLRQIAVLVLLAAVLAIVAAMFAAVWQRRDDLASLRVLGFGGKEMYRALVYETGIVVLLGGILGLGLGFICQGFASRWIEMTSGYQTPIEPAIGLGLTTLAEMLALTTIATLGPAILAWRFSRNAVSVT
ncbi:MAG: ABC transporter permease [Actinobacteria bacterium]|nr:ABC transporter permease [Actinomycetota bacterium]